MKYRPIKIISALLVAGFMLVPAEVYAWEQGHIKIVPSLKVEEKWDSNIFYDSSDEKSDWITVITPGIMGEWGFGDYGKHKLKLDYKVDCGIFAEYNDQNYGNHDVFGEVKLDFNDYRVKVNERFQFTSSRAGTEFENRTLRKINTFNTILEADFNKFSMDLGYTHYLVDYLSDTLETLDYYTNSVWVTGYVQVMPKTKALLEFKYTNLQYPDASGRNGNAYRIMVGAKGQFTEKLTGIAKVGYKYKDYQDSSQDAFSSVVFNTYLVWSPLERLQLITGYEREAFESTYINNNFYTGDHFFWDIVYKLPSNFVAKLNIFYDHNAYSEIAPGDSEKRTDNIWGIGPRLEYWWKEWLVAGVGYAYKQRFSNIGNREYKDHVIGMDVKAQY